MDDAADPSLRKSTQVNSILLDHLKVALNEKLIFQDVTMTIEQGEFIGIFGANGAGKTTLLRTILGLITPENGTVRVCGRAAEKGNPDIGYAPQMRRELEMFPLCGRSLLQASACGMGWGFPILDRAKKHQIEDAIQLTSLEHIVDRPYPSLSGGERQRLALACALVGNPKILLLDEPLNNLDPHQNEKIIELLTYLNHTLRTTVLITSHQIQPLIQKLNRIICLQEGQAIILNANDADTQTFVKLYQPTEHEKNRECDTPIF